ncbi:WhiB family transcriptional regulator [Nocardiopsis composta]
MTGAGTAWNAPGSARSWRWPAARSTPRSRKRLRARRGSGGHATCAGEPLRLFYGPSVEKPAAREARVAKAKAICGRCPVRTECAEDAVARGEKWGVRGGLTGTELKRERRRRMKRAVARSQVVCSCCGKTGPRGGPAPTGC